MSEILRATLLASKLLETKAALLALDEGWRIERVSGPSTASQMSVATYSLRAEHLKKFEGQHLQRLAASTGEFAENLRLAIGTDVECIKITGSGEGYFLMFLSTESRHILGCMLVHDNGKEAYLHANGHAV